MTGPVMFLADGFIAAVRRRLAADDMELVDGVQRAAVDLAAYVLRQRIASVAGASSTTPVSAGNAATSTGVALDGPEASSAATVLVVPLVRDGLDTHSADPVALSRVPVVGELVRLPIGDFLVRGVRHTPGCATAADVWLDPVLTAANRDRAVAARDDSQGSFAGVG